MHIHELNACLHYIDFASSIKMIHDADDKLPPISESKALAKTAGAELCNDKFRPWKNIKKPGLASLV